MRNFLKPTFDPSEMDKDDLIALMELCYKYELHKDALFLQDYLEQNYHFV